MRIIDHLRQINDEIARVDTTGGSAQAIMLETDGVRKALLRLRKSGVSVEMELSPDEAAEFIAELKEVLRWTRKE
jgi:SH3-like domain-containing protein